jgi:hypothetical protein
VRRCDIGACVCRYAARAEMPDTVIKQLVPVITAKKALSAFFCCLLLVINKIL